MKISKLPVNNDSLVVYSKIPISYEATTELQLEVRNNGLEGIVFQEKQLKSPFVHDYDQLEDEGLIRWPKQFNTSNWAIFLATENSIAIGGATVAFWTPEIRMFQDRKDIALVWDIRVLPEWRRKGVGTKLFTRAIALAKRKGCRFLKVETQNTNPSACKFYVSQGCRLGEINRFAYTDPRITDEIMMVWYYEL